jgi:hypothetical protein
MSALRSGIVWISFTSGFEGEVAKADRLVMNILSKPASSPVMLFNGAVLIGPDSAVNRKGALPPFPTPTKPTISHPQGPQRPQVLRSKRQGLRTQYQTKAAKFAEISKRAHVRHHHYTTPTK